MLFRSYFFRLAMAQADYELAKDNVATTDTLYAIGEQRKKIAAISQADLLTLKLDKKETLCLIENLKNKVWQGTINKETLNECLDRYKVSNIYNLNGLYKIKIVSDTCPLNMESTEPTLEDVYLYYFGDEQ